MKITFLADADFNDDAVKGALRREPPSIFAARLRRAARTD